MLTDAWRGLLEIFQFARFFNTWANRLHTIIETPDPKRKNAKSAQSVRCHLDQAILAC